MSKDRQILRNIRLANGLSSAKVTSDAKSQLNEAAETIQGSITPPGETGGKTGDLKLTAHDPLPAKISVFLKPSSN